MTRRARALAILVAVGVFGAPTAAVAQEVPPSAAEIAVGWVGFADDGIVSEAMMGGAGHLYVSPRLAIGPELVYIHGNNHSHLVVTGNVTFDILGPSRDGPPRVTPFLVAGGGVYQTRSEFPTGTFTSSEGAFTAGGGIRALVGERATVGVDARVGWELHLRINATVGWRFGR